MYEIFIWLAESTWYIILALGVLGVIELCIVPFIKYLIKRHKKRSVHKENI